MSHPKLKLLLASSLCLGSIHAQRLAQVYNQLDINATIPETAQAKSVLENGNPKIDASLRNLIGGAQSKSVSGLAASAKSLDIPMEEGLIAVTASAREDGAGALAARIEELGGTVTTTLDDTVFARVPASAIERLGQARQLDYLTAQSTYRLVQSAGAPGTGNKGVLVTKANLLHQRGLRGRGVKVGILDFGYTKYKILQQQGLVPEPKAIKTFHANGVWDRPGGSEHGAACAEIIHAMAPDAEIYIASVGDGTGTASTDEIIQAGQWLATQGVDIVSFSGGGHGGPHNGTDIMDKLVALVVGKGILWVNAAGNEGSRHWGGQSELNDKGLLKIGAKGEPYLLVQANSNKIGLLVTWDDWGPNPQTPSSTQDIDAFLFAINQTTGDAQLVAQSINPQNGRGAPQEIIVADATQGQIYALFLRGTHLTRSVRVHVHELVPAAMEPHTAWGSIGIPATSPLALSVGAVHVDTLKLEPYSSQGPTDDNRPKPELTAPANTLSVAYGARFAGTSAACPHAAGFAALLKQHQHEATVQQLYASVVQATTSLGVEGTGRGIIDGSKVSGGGGGGGDTQQPPSTGPRGPKLDIPTFFGSSVSSKSLDRLMENATDEGAFGAKIVTGSKTYRFGDGLKIGYRVREECHFMVIHRSAHGEYTVLAPTGGSDTTLRPNEPYKLANIEITPPAGVEHVILICSKDPIDIEKFRAGNDEGLSVSVVRYTIEEN
jgi:Subtilase family/Domain of unknown function (DUF4384)